MSSPNQESFGKCVTQIYDAAMRPALWNAFMQTVSEAVGGSMNLLIFGKNGLSGAGNFFIHNRIPADALQIYREHYFLENDLYYQAIKDRNLVGKAFIGSEHISDKLLKKSAMYHDFLKPGEGGYFLCAPVVATSDETFGLAIHRPMHGSNFNSEHKSFIAQLMPHLLRAFQIHTRYCECLAEKQVAQQALQIMKTATVLLDKKGDVLFCNRAAEKLLSGKDGVYYKNKRLWLSEQGKQAELNRLISAAALTSGCKGYSPGGTMTVTRPSGKAAYRMIVTPLASDSEHHFMLAGVASCVFIDNPDEYALLPSEMLRGFYRLTPAEIEVARLFFRGCGLNEISQLLHIKITTARTHFYNIMAKTGTHTQAELTKLLAIGAVTYISSAARPVSMHPLGKHL